MRHDAPIVPDFTPVTADQILSHLDHCPACQGRMDNWCPTGKSLIARFADQGRRESEKSHQAQAWDLINAGWRFEVPGLDSGVMSWRWRSPPKRRGSRGKFHASTNQAWRSMRRAAGTR